MYLQVLHVRLQSLQVQLQVANWLYKSRKWANEVQVHLRHLVNIGSDLLSRLTLANGLHVFVSTCKCT